MSEHSAKRMSLPSADPEHWAKTSFAEGRVVVEGWSLGTRQRQPLPSARDKKTRQSYWHSAKLAIPVVAGAEKDKASLPALYLDTREQFKHPVQ